MTKQDQKFGLMEEYERCNLTISAFCAARSLKVPTFHYWRRKYRASQAAPKGFIPISNPANTERSAIRLSYPNGVNIHLPAADIVLLAQLIRLA